jgi:leucyl-tRNA synthetase
MPLAAECPIPRSTLDAMRREFEYGYPLDLRVSGKELISNHLTMALYHHAAIWQNAGPGSDVASGAPAAPAGDGLEDANFERDSADNLNTILRLTIEEDLIKELLAEEAGGTLRGGALNFPDAVFEARINTAIASAEAAYEAMRFRDALQLGFYLL